MAQNAQQVRDKALAEVGKTRAEIEAELRAPYEEKVAQLDKEIARLKDEKTKAN